MITAADFLCLPYTADLTEAGISYACRSLVHTYERTGSSPLERLRRVVAGIAVELAFRRSLTQQEIPFGIQGATPFTDPDRYDVSLGGHRCDIKSFLISHREQVSSLHAAPSQLLNAPGLVPSDQFAGDGHSSTDLYLFAFLTGLVAASAEDMQKARQAGQPAYFVHAMSSSWARPHAWVPLGPLAFKSESDQALTVEIGGQDADREFIRRAFELPPRTRVQVEDDFHSLAYVHADARPGARLGVHSSTRHETCLIEPVDWGNIWVYGLRMYMAGWITREEFRQRAGLLPEGSRVFQYDRTRIKNLAVPICELHPLPELLSRARAWAAARSNVSGFSIV